MMRRGNGLPRKETDMTGRKTYEELRSARWMMPDDQRSFGHRSRTMQMVVKARVAGNAPSAEVPRRLAAAMVPAFVEVITGAFTCKAVIYC